MKTPAYAPREPLTDRTRYARNVKKYGPAPKGWRWRQVGERYQSDDLCATNDSWYRLQSEGPIGETTYPIATPVKVLVKRDSRGRFAPEVVAAKTLPDLGDTFRDSHSDDSLDALKNYVDCINKVLANIEDWDAWYGIFGWSLTPQGFKHWSDRQDGNPAPSPEDLDYLRAAKEFFEKRIAELTPAPAPSPTVPELQAKISSLETELASLRRKIAGAKVTFPE